jgi:Papain fold toxin 1, glutamine deamidase
VPRGIVYGANPVGRVGHVWNAANQNGTIRFVDGQVGGSGIGNFDKFTNFKFLLTNPGGG